MMPKRKMKGQSNLVARKRRSCEEPTAKAIGQGRRMGWWVKTRFRRVLVSFALTLPFIDCLPLSYLVKHLKKREKSLAVEVERREEGKSFSIVSSRDNEDKDTMKKPKPNFIVYSFACPTVVLCYTFDSTLLCDTFSSCNQPSVSLKH